MPASVMIEAGSWIRVVNTNVTKTAPPKRDGDVDDRRGPAELMRRFPARRLEGRTEVAFGEINLIRHNSPLADRQ